MKARRWAAALVLFPLLMAADKNCAGQPIDNQDNSVRTDPNPKKPEPNHPVYYLYNMHWEDIPGGAFYTAREGGAGVPRHGGGPGVDDSASNRYPPGEVFTPDQIPKGIPMEVTLVATTPSLELPKGFKPKLFCSITKVDAVTHEVIDILRPEKSSSDRKNGVVCRAVVR